MQKEKNEEDKRTPKRKGKRDLDQENRKSEMENVFLDADKVSGWRLQRSKKKKIKRLPRRKNKNKNASNTLRRERS